MKNQILIGLLLMLPFAAFSQSSAITNAALYLKDKQLDKAAEIINSAISNEKTINNPKTWYYRGLIYQSLIGSDSAAWASLRKDAESEAYTSYLKAIELDSENGEYAKLSARNLAALYPAFVNKGYNEYNALQFETALKSFESAMKIEPSDTTAYIYASFAAEQLSRYDLIKEYVEKLDQLGYKNVQTWVYKINIAANLDNKPEEALALSKQALTENPGNLSLLQEQTNLYITQGKVPEAISNLQTMIQLSPANVEYTAMLASLYDQSGEKDKALEYYNKSLDLNPSHFLSMYNSAIIYYDEGKKLDVLIHQMPLNEYQSKGKEKETEEKAVFQKSLDRANKALLLATEASDRENIKLLIEQINKVLTNK